MSIFIWVLFVKNFWKIGLKSTKHMIIENFFILKNRWSKLIHCRLKIIAFLIFLSYFFIHDIKISFIIYFHYLLFLLKNKFSIKLVFICYFHLPFFIIIFTYFQTIRFIIFKLRIIIEHFWTAVWLINQKILFLRNKKLTLWSLT